MNSQEVFSSIKFLYLYSIRVATIAWYVSLANSLTLIKIFSSLRSSVIAASKYTMARESNPTTTCQRTFNTYRKTSSCQELSLSYVVRHTYNFVIRYADVIDNNLKWKYSICIWQVEGRRRHRFKMISVAERQLLKHNRLQSTIESGKVH